MASISRDPGGRRRILFKAPDGKRKAIRLGKVPQRAAEAVKVKVEHLVAAAVSGCGWDNETARWVAEISDELGDKLAAVGLVPPRERAGLAAWLDRYIGRRSDVKPGTVLAYRQARENLVECFGADRPLRTITPGDADDFRVFLVNKGYAEATVGRRIKHAKTFFGAAFRKRLVTENPFAEAKGGSQQNKAREYFVSRQDTQSVIDACPDAQWRLLVALARFGGLRVPSEASRLRWCDLDWHRGRMTVHSPKTEHHKGKATRTVPIFPELRPILEEAWDAAEPRAVYVVPMIRDDSQNLRSGLERIVYRAGLIPWPRLWQNMRASRATELAELFPGHVAAAWLGHTERVADAHYRQVLDAHYQRATGVAQNQAQSAHRIGRTGSSSGSPAPVFPELDDLLRTCTAVYIGPEGCLAGASGWFGAKFAGRANKVP